jgi:hypothetical protein
MDQTILFMVGSAFIFFGVAISTFFFYRIYQAFASTRWPSVVGELDSAELKEVVYRGNAPHGGPDEASAWVVNFQYHYTVADKKYDGKRVTYSDGINKTMRALRKLRNKYQGKSTIQVYYNPNNPRQSVLVPGPTLFSFTPLITCVLFVLAGLFIFTLDV